MSGTITPSKPDIKLQSELSSQIPANDTPGIGEFIQETFALTKRLFIQLQRRPSTLIAGIIQPVMWLVLFGALFQNAPQGTIWQ
jgi:ABC-2 type transport system permease protein